MLALLNKYFHISIFYLACVDVYCICLCIKVIYSKYYLHSNEYCTFAVLIFQAVVKISAILKMFTTFKDIFYHTESLSIFALIVEATKLIFCARAGAYLFFIVCMYLEYITLLCMCLRMIDINMLL